MNKSKTTRESNNKLNLCPEIHQYKHKRSIINSDNVSSSQNESIENSSKDKFDWDWIFEKGWLRTKK
ncbi:MAG: hypothetical protein ACFFC1_05380 [Promethearchaeota archaeon]